MIVIIFSVLLPEYQYEDMRNQIDQKLWFLSLKKNEHN